MCSMFFYLDAGMLENEDVITTIDINVSLAMEGSPERKVSSSYSKPNEKIHKLQYLVIKISKSTLLCQC